LVAIGKKEQAIYRKKRKEREKKGKIYWMCRDQNEEKR
jgi:hypothetical protein